MNPTTPAQVTGFSVVLGDDWYAVPLGDDRAADWADGLVGRWGVEGLAHDTLRDQLERMQEVFSEAFGDAVSAFVWVPMPESGYTSGSFVGVDWPLGSSGISDTGSFLAAFGEGRFVDAGDTVLEQRLWEGEYAAGPFAAVHRVTSSPVGDEAPSAGGEETILETVDYAIFPPGASEFIHLRFGAESISSFDDMPAQTQEIAASLIVKLGGAA